MVFSSLLFLFAFLPVALAVFFVVSAASRYHQSVCCWTLTVLSLAFYFWGSGIYLLLIGASIVFNWYVGRQLPTLASQGRQRLLVTAIAVNLGALAYFKYARFFLDNLGSFTGSKFAPDFHPYLPVGVSFFTFMSVAYLIDIYRQEQEPTTLTRYATYLSLFPHLVAGPIVRYREISADFATLSRPSLEKFNVGIFRFAQGLGMKVLLADNLATAADRIFALDPRTLSLPVAWLGALTYTFQIYFDFAGYSAMAIGLALMFGFHFPENFDQPYRAVSVTEFWRRWHMTLSRFLRDYLYIPLGGNRKGHGRTYLNLVLVFLVCGLWHGAAWPFVIWGLYQGMLLISERLLKERFGFEQAGWSGLATTFLLTCFGWVIFRSESVPQAGRFLQAMLGFSPNSGASAATGTYLDPLLVAVMLLAILFSFIPVERLAGKNFLGPSWRFALKSAACSALLVTGSVYSISNSYKPFIYFRF